MNYLQDFNAISKYCRKVLLTITGVRVKPLAIRFFLYYRNEYFKALAFSILYTTELVRIKITY